MSHAPVESSTAATRLLLWVSIAVVCTVPRLSLEKPVADPPRACVVTIYTMSIHPCLGTHPFHPGSLDELLFTTAVGQTHPGGQADRHCALEESGRSRPPKSHVSLSAAIFTRRAGGLVGAFAECGGSRTYKGCWGAGGVASKSLVSLVTRFSETSPGALRSPLLPLSRSSLCQRNPNPRDLPKHRLSLGRFDCMLLLRGAGLGFVVCKSADSRRSSGCICFIFRPPCRRCSALRTQATTVMLVPSRQLTRRSFDPQLDQHLVLGVFSSVIASMS